MNIYYFYNLISFLNEKFRRKSEPSNKWRCIFSCNGLRSSKATQKSPVFLNRIDLKSINQSDGRRKNYFSWHNGHFYWTTEYNFGSVYTCFESESESESCRRLNKLSSGNPSFVMSCTDLYVHIFFYSGGGDRFTIEMHSG